MYRIKSSAYLSCLWGLCVLLAFSACVSTPAPQSANPGASAASSNNASNRPAWIRAVYSVFDQNLYVAAVGSGGDLAQAEKSAYANLTATFGQAIQESVTLTNSYAEMTRSSGASSWTESTSLQSAIQTSTSLDALLGSEIMERYNDGGVWYAAAVMDKAKATQLYTGIITSNLDMIEKLTGMSATDKNSLEGLSRYQFAAVVADINASYGRVLTAIGAPVPPGIKDGGDYRREARAIIAAIPVNVTVQNDRSNRVRDAFAKVFTQQGFNTGGTNSRYRMNVTLTLSEAVYPNSTNKWIRYELAANFTDTRGNIVLLPFNVNDREGHPASLSEAENRAIRAVEQKIEKEFPALLSDYLAKLMPN